MYPINKGIKRRETMIHNIQGKTNRKVRVITLLGVAGAGYRVQRRLNVFTLAPETYPLNPCLLSLFLTIHP